MKDTLRASAKDLLDGLDAHLASLPPDTTFKVTPWRLASPSAYSLFKPPTKEAFEALTFVSVPDGYSEAP